MHPRSQHLPAWRASLTAAALVGAIGCAGGPTLLNVRFNSGAPLAPEATATSTLGDRLARLRAERGPGRGDGDYVLGRGDLLSVRAFDFDQLNARVRVESDGTIRLPLLNTIPVGGRSLADVEKELTRRLGDYMYDPHVSVFIEEYRSQQVSVEGAVQKPGLINETGRNLTVLDSIAAAGGMTPEAGTIITFMPTRVRQQAAGTADPNCNGAPATDEVADGAPITVNTAELDDDTRRAFMSMPVREGDVVRVQTAGTFYTTGWFDKPGAYPLHAGLTLRGAIAEAEGFSFPAKTDDIRIYRPGANGKTEMRRVNYEQIAKLETPDVVLHDGDVLEVSGSPVRMVPWGFYKFITAVVHLGYKVAK